jgi:hypothetical protein
MFYCQAYIVMQPGTQKQRDIAEGGCQQMRMYLICTAKTTHALFLQCNVHCLSSVTCFVFVNFYASLNINVFI